MVKMILKVGLDINQSMHGMSISYTKHYHTNLKKGGKIINIADVLQLKKVVKIGEQSNV
jgi:hypothetical protein